MRTKPVRKTKKYNDDMYDFKKGQWSKEKVLEFEEKWTSTNKVFISESSSSAENLIYNVESHGEYFNSSLAFIAGYVDDDGKISKVDFRLYSHDGNEVTDSYQKYKQKISLIKEMLEEYESELDDMYMRHINRLGAFNDK